MTQRDAEAELPRAPLGVGWDRLAGWRSQYDRMLRWHERLLRIAAIGTEEAGWDECWDVAFAFFQNAYFVKDWIRAERPDLADSLESLIRDDSAMGYCADVCNGTKHREVNRNHRVPGHLAGGRVYRPNEPSRERLVVFGPDGPVDALDLAARCVNAWRGYVTEHLTPSV